MGGKSESESEAIAIINADDTESWAMFLKNKLCGDDYKIKSYLHDPHQNYIPQLFNCTQTCVVLVSPSLLEQPYCTFWNSCIDRFHHRTLIILLGVDTKDVMVSLGPQHTNSVMACHWLEVDGSKEAVTNALVKMIELYESSNGSYLQSLQEKLVLREGCDEHEKGNWDHDQEDQYAEIQTDDVYDYPPQPVQQNGVVRVMPTILYECDSREVLVLLERKAEETVVMVTEPGCGPSQHITMEHLATSAYIATLPSNCVGKVHFMVLSGEHCLGRSSLHVHSSMDQLNAVLQNEMKPLTLLCSAMGVPGDSPYKLEEFDSLLSKKLSLSHFPTGLGNILEEQSKSDDLKNSQWPTLLHFAAEFNLARTCEELLQYPGMIHAACQENCDGLFPCQLAEKNGHQDLQRRLMQFVEDMRVRRSAADSGISFSEGLPTPAPHGISSHIYVNDSPVLEDVPSFDGCDYVQMDCPLPSGQAMHRGSSSTCQEVPRVKFRDMEDCPVNMPPPPSPCQRTKNDGYAKPRSYSEGCVKIACAKIPSENRIAEEEDFVEGDPPPLKPKVGRSKSLLSSQISPCVSTLQTQSDPSSSQDSDGMDVKINQTDISRQISTETLTDSESGVSKESEIKSDELSARVSWQLQNQVEARPVSQTSSSTSQSDYEVFPKQQPGFTEDLPVLRGKNTKRSKSVQDTISLFLKKIKSGRKLSSSTSENDLFCKGQKKWGIHARQSTVSTNSDPGQSTSALRRSKLSSGISESERDSGAVCDDHDTAVIMRSTDKNRPTPRNSGKRNGISMQRRVSIRIQKAKNEDLSERPTLPARTSSALSKETFRSFIKEKDSS